MNHREGLTGESTHRALRKIAMNVRKNRLSTVRIACITVSKNPPSYLVRLWAYRIVVVVEEVVAGV
jgi:hypothetical protein